MSQTALTMTREELQKYHLPSPASSRAAGSRRERAWGLAKKAADMLRGDFGAQRVVVFGSLVPGAWFTAVSDIDLAVWGIPAEQYYRAVAAVSELSADFRIDLVDPSDCSAPVRKAILESGIEI